MATYTAIKDGLFSDGTVWDLGAMPYSNLDTIIIPTGRTVYFDVSQHAISTGFVWQIDGTLKWQMRNPLTILSITKGSTTTIVTSTPHGLTANQPIYLYGINTVIGLNNRNSTVYSVTNSTTFVISASTTSSLGANGACNGTIVVGGMLKVASGSGGSGMLDFSDNGNVMNRNQLPVCSTAYLSGANGLKLRWLTWQPTNMVGHLTSPYTSGQLYLDVDTDFANTLQNNGGSTINILDLSYVGSINSGSAGTSDAGSISTRIYIANSLMRDYPVGSVVFPNSFNNFLGSQINISTFLNNTCECTIGPNINFGKYNNQIGTMHGQLNYGSIIGSEGHNLVLNSNNTIGSSKLYDSYILGTASIISAYVENTEVYTSGGISVAGNSCVNNCRLYSTGASYLAMLVSGIIKNTTFNGNSTTAAIACLTSGSRGVCDNCTFNVGVEFNRTNLQVLDILVESYNHNGITGTYRAYTIAGVIDKRVDVVPPNHDHSYRLLQITTGMENNFTRMVSIPPYHSKSYKIWMRMDSYMVGDELPSCCIYETGSEGAYVPNAPTYTNKVSMTDETNVWQEYILTVTNNSEMERNYTLKFINNTAASFYCTYDELSLPYVGSKNGGK